MPARPWTTDQLRAFLDATTDHEHGALWRVLATTGMRAGEVRALRWRHVDLSSGTVAVPAARAKTVAARTIRLDPGTVAALVDHHGQGDGHGLVFTTRTGRPWTTRTLGLAFRRVVAAADLPVIRLHDLRLMHVARLFEARTTVHTIARCLGVTPAGAVAMLGRAGA